jgi:GMP synthase (glutamine-hydrolysing)
MFINQVKKSKVKVELGKAVTADEIKKAKLYRQLWQSFAILTEVRSVGVMGDYRTYGYLVAIRAVTSEDAMTADWARLPMTPGPNLQPHRQRGPRH